MKKYKLQNYNYLLKDKKSTKFHIENNDFFITIISILKLIKEKNTNKINDKVLSNLIKDFYFLNENYSIIAKNIKKVKNPEAKVNNQ